jgi:hypothetical protein
MAPALLQSVRPLSVCPISPSFRSVRTPISVFVFGTLPSLHREDDHTYFCSRVSVFILRAFQIHLINLARTGSARNLMFESMPSELCQSRGSASLAE